MKKETYEEFVDKFKPKKTTDDCYIPFEIYEIIKKWAIKEYNLKGKEVVRPFYPGGNFENCNYPDGCVVVDNPPFSILSKIIRWFLEKNIKFFLFAPHLTLFSNTQDVSFIVVGIKIEYENGAKIPTSFITNMDDYKIRSANDLFKQLIFCQSKKKRENPKYDYSDNVITSTKLERLVKNDIDFYFLRMIYLIYQL